MKEYKNKLIALALAGALFTGGMTACGKKEEKTIEPKDAAATVDGETVPAGVVALLTRYQQMYYEAMYASFGMDASGYWDMAADEESGETYGDQTVDQALEQAELMYILRAHAGDYDVTLTEEEIKEAEEASKKFVEANSEESLKEIPVNEECVTEYLELIAYQEKMREPMLADVDREVSDEEAQQTSITYTLFEKPAEETPEAEGEETEEVAPEETPEAEGEETEEKAPTAEEMKEMAEKLLEEMKKDPEADMNEAAVKIYDKASASAISYSTNDEEDTTIPQEVKDALKDKKDGEVVPEVIETSTGYYVVRLDKVFDEEETENKKQSIIQERENEKYTEITDGWMADAKIEKKEDVVKAIDVTSEHRFVFKAAETNEDTVEYNDEEIDPNAIEPSDEEVGEMEDAAALGEEDQEMIEDQTAMENAEEIPAEEELESAESSNPDEKTEETEEAK